MERPAEKQMHGAFTRAVRTAALVIAALFICAAAVEWLRSAYEPFQGYTDYPWIKGARNFFYLMSMFNIFLIRYVIMRIYTAGGHINDETVIRRLYRADVASLWISGLPCLYGLILFLMDGDQVDFYLLFGLSLIYIMIYFPRTKKWVSVIEERTTTDRAQDGSGPNNIHDSNNIKED